MRIVFAGTPAFALPTLQALHAKGYDILAVYTQPDRPAGRGRKLTSSPIKQYALEHTLPLYQPTTLRGEENRLSVLKPDVMVVVAYGLLLPPSILAIPQHGCLNVHASLLPRWRGAAPIARAIEAGDSETGITIMQMEAGLDTGPMLLRRVVPILANDTAGSLEERLAPLGAEALLSTVSELTQGSVVPEVQDDRLACYAPKLTKHEAPVDWSLPAIRIHRKIRALNPWPVACTTWHGGTLRLWEVGALELHTAASTPQKPGTIVAADATGLHIQTGDGVLCITRLQAAGARALSAREFLNGTKMSVGDLLGN